VAQAGGWIVNVAPPKNRLALDVPPAAFHHWYADIMGLDLPLLAVPIS